MRAVKREFASKSIAPKITVMVTVVLDSSDFPMNSEAESIPGELFPDNFLLKVAAAAIAEPEIVT